MEFIESLRSAYPLAIICSALKMTTSAYYAAKRRGENTREHEDARMLIEIRNHFVFHKKRYGSTRMANVYFGSGRRRRIARLMRQANLVSVHTKKYRPMQYEAAPPERCYANVVNRNFTVDRPNAVWVTDITYVWTYEGWLYVAAVIDLYSRAVVGLAMSHRIDADLATAAMSQAVMHRKPPKDLVCHSDRGCQYTSELYRAFLSAHDFVGSMSRKGNCWDNAVAESFFRTLKVEQTNRFMYRTREQARSSVFEYVEIYYNRQRAHSACRYATPFEYEKRTEQTINNVH